jgi:hypothetical protein
MDAIVLDDIPMQIDVPALLQRMHLPAGGEQAQSVMQLVEQAMTVGRPKALYKVAPIDSKGETTVVVEGTRLTSRILRVNLERPRRVFPFVATCGVELEAWVPSNEGLLHSYYADQIREMALRSAIAHMRQAIAERHGLDKAAMMNPGSLADWPLKEQRPLFSILGDPTGAIGVRLTSKLLMLPVKSASGILFPNEDSYENCQLCTMENCPGRRAPYVPGSLERKYAH